MKKIHISMALALIFTLLMTMTGFEARCDSIRTNVLRLHVLANSDSDYDQVVKLAVRDRILSECGDLFERVDGYDAALEQAESNLPALCASAQAQLREMGCDYPVSVEIAPTDFDTRVYDDVTLPAGEYTALQVRIGEAKGKNWWCVCYPNLCIPAASQTEEVSEVLDEDEAEVVTNSGKYIMRFKIVEWYEQLKTRLKKG